MNRNIVAWGKMKPTIVGLFNTLYFYYEKLNTVSAETLRLHWKENQTEGINDTVISNLLMFLDPDYCFIGYLLGKFNQK